AGGRVPAGVAQSPSVTALVGGRVQASPDVDPIADGVVLIDRDTIAAVGPRANVRIPSGATVIDCAGATVVAGFWNSHVHFMQPVWRNAATAPAPRLGDALRAMLTSYGVVNVLDTGSFPGNTPAFA